MVAAMVWVLKKLIHGSSPLVCNNTLEIFPHAL